MTTPSPDTSQLRRWIYHLLIAIAFAIACGRIASVQRVFEPAFHRDPAKEGDRRPLWPKTRPESNAMFGSNDRARWATMRAWFTTAPTSSANATRPRHGSPS